MPWEYFQGSGELRHNGLIVDTGYSGSGYAKNSPDQEHISNMGPIPRGTWMLGQAYHSGTKGPYTMDLSPYGHNAHGRTLFRIHGDSLHNPGTASEGCIVLSRAARIKISKSGDTVLYVVR